MAARLGGLSVAATAAPCLAIGIAVGPSAAGAGEQFRDVIVRNTTSDPVPVAPQGNTEEPVAVK